MAKRTKNKLTKAKHESLLHSIKVTWDYIAEDWINLCGGCCTSEDVREGVGDRIDNPLWNQIDWTTKNELLAEAFPNGRSYGI